MDRQPNSALELLQVELQQAQLQDDIEPLVVITCYKQLDNLKRYCKTIRNLEHFLLILANP